MKILNVFNFKGLWLAALIFLSISHAWAIPYYWVAPSGAQLWNDPQNWSLTSGGSGGAGVPGLGDDAFFDSNGAGDCFVDITGLEVESLTFEPGYSGLIDLGSTTLSTQQIVNFQTPMQNGVIRVLGGRIQIQTSNLAIELNGITDDLNLLSNTIQNANLTITGATLNSVTGNTFTSTIDFRRAGPGVLVFESNSFQDVTLRNQNNVGNIITQGNESYNTLYAYNEANSSMDLAYAGGATTLNNQIVLVNTQNGTISMGLGGGTATLENFASFQIDDFGTGTVSLNNFTVNGTYNPSLTTLTGTTHLHIANCTFNSQFSQIIPRITCGTGNQFNNLFVANVTGDQPSSISGAFNNVIAFTNIIRSGTGTLTLESNNFQGYLALTNSNNAGSIRGTGNEVYSNLDVFNYADSPVDLAHSGGSSSFRGNVRFINTQNGTISTGVGGGLAVLETMGTFEMGQFGTGTVSLNNLTVNGTYNPFLTTLTGTTHLHLANCTFNSGFSQIIPRITCGPGNQFNQNFLAEVTGDQPSSITGNFNLLATIIRNGDGNLVVSSGNFIGNALVRNESSAGSLQLSENTFNQLVTFTQTNGTLQPAANGTSIFRGNVTFNTGTSGSDFIVGSSPTQGVMRLEGGINQNINATGNANIIIHRIELDKSAGAMNVNTPFSIATSITFTQGVMRTSDTNFIRFLDGAIASGATALSHIEGPARKLGNDAFTFPVGDGGTLRPIAISAPSSITDEFTARFFRTTHPYGGVATYSPPLLTVSECEYWTLDRTTGTSNVFVTLGWQTTECTGPYVTEPTTLEVARWNGTQWVSHGQGSFTGSSAAGTVTSAIAVSSFSPFAVGSTTLSNPLPITLLDFNAIVETSQVVLQWRTASEINSSYFAVQRSANGAEFETIGQVDAAQFSQSVLRYTYVDEHPLAGKSYYRLKMIDQDGTSEFSKIIFVNFDEQLLQFYPNPTTDILHLTQPRRIKLSTLLGINVLLLAEPVVKITLPPDLVAGTYLLQTDQGEMFRIVIAR
jgi:hypothetical protein